jgi:hypothetical protein
LRASILCDSDRCGALVGVLVAAGMGGDYTQARVTCKVPLRNFFLFRLCTSQSSTRTKNKLRLFDRYLQSTTAPNEIAQMLDADFR